MSLAIFYTPTAKETLQAVYHFVENKFGQRPADKFLEKAERIIDLLAVQPELFKVSAIHEDVRIALITKQCSLFYQVKTDAIHLLFFWDNRQEPLHF